MRRNVPRFRTGNVIRDPNGGLWVVSRIGGRENDVIVAISFDHESVEATQRLDDHDETRWCAECEDDECETCHGTGSYVEHIKGWNRSELLAPSVREFILDGMKKTFGL